MWGQANGEQVTVTSDKDHPHACGDKLRGCEVFKILVGSSPCVWGQVLLNCGKELIKRIIPMRVGTSNQGTVFAPSLKDHPHACGDKNSRTFKGFYTTGSSPCVWGQEHRRLQHPSLARIIPMRVGTSARCLFSCFSRKDHPHACGDKKGLFEITQIY